MRVIAVAAAIVLALPLAACDPPKMIDNMQCQVHIPITLKGLQNNRPGLQLDCHGLTVYGKPPYLDNELQINYLVSNPERKLVCSILSQADNARCTFVE